MATARVATTIYEIVQPAEYSSGDPRGRHVPRGHDAPRDYHVIHQPHTISLFDV